MITGARGIHPNPGECRVAPEECSEVERPGLVYVDVPASFGVASALIIRVYIVEVMFAHKTWLSLRDPRIAAFAHRH